MCVCVVWIAINTDFYVCRFSNDANIFTVSSMQTSFIHVAHKSIKKLYRRRKKVPSWIWASFFRLLVFIQYRFEFYCEKRAREKKRNIGNDDTEKKRMKNEQRICWCVCECSYSPFYILARVAFSSMWTLNIWIIWNLDFQMREVPRFYFWKKEEEKATTTATATSTATTAAAMTTLIT